jgi:hypothetical protein
VAKSATARPVRIKTAFEVVGLLLAVLAVAIPAYLSIRAEQRKLLVIDLVAVRPLLNIESPGQPELEVLFNRITVNRPWLISAAISNAGNRPIEARDIEVLPSLDIYGASIISAYVTGSSPEGVRANAILDGGSVLLSLGLMNAGESIYLDVLVDGQPTTFAASGRISGLTSPIEVRQQDRTLRRRLVAPFDLPEPLEAAILFLAASAAALGIIGAPYKLVQLPRRSNSAAAPSRPDRLGTVAQVGVWVLAILASIAVGLVTAGSWASAF